MAIDIKTVDHIALLSRLKFSPEETEKLQSQLSRIIDYIDKLTELNTDTIETTSQDVALCNVMRKDEPGNSLPIESAIGNAPDRTENTFRVPSVI